MVMQMAAMGAVSLRCEVSRGSGGGGFFLPVAGLRRRVLVEALRCVVSAPCKSAQWVSLPCDALRLQPVAHRRRGVVSAARNLSATPATQVVSVRSVVSDARCPSITSMVQCRCWVSADQCRLIAPASPQAGLSLPRVRRASPCDCCAWVAMSFSSANCPVVCGVATFSLSV